MNFKRGFLNSSRGQRTIAHRDVEPEPVRVASAAPDPESAVAVPKAAAATPPVTYTKTPVPIATSPPAVPTSSGSAPTGAGAKPISIPPEVAKKLSTIAPLESWNVQEYSSADGAKMNGAGSRTGAKKAAAPEKMTIANAKNSDAPAIPAETRAWFKDGGKVPLPKLDYVYTTLPARSDNPSKAETLDGWCEALVDSDTERSTLKFFAEHPPPKLPRNKTPAYRIAPIGGKGLGMIATRDLQTGDLIVAERPLVMAPVINAPSAEEFPDGVPVDITQRELVQAQFKAGERQIERLVAKMSPERRAAYDALTNCHEGDGCGPLMGRFRTNGIGIEGKYKFMGQEDEAGIFSVVLDDISRANHSCRPNASHFFDTKWFAMVLRPVRPIKAGEEICISYFAGGCPPYEERKAELASYGFECKCEACLDPAASDARRLEIATPLESQLQRGDISGALKATLGRIALIRREGLEELQQYKSLYVQLEMTFRLMGDLARAAEVKKESDRLSWAHFNEPGFSLFF